MGDKGSKLDPPVCWSGGFEPAINDLFLLQVFATVVDIKSKTIKLERSLISRGIILFLAILNVMLI